MGCCLLWCTIAFSYLLSVPVCHYIKSSAIIVWHLLFPLFFFVCNYYLSVNVTWCHLLLSAITSYDLLLSAMFATIWCYIQMQISVIFRGYLTADSICYCQLLCANIGYYLFCLLLSIIICSCLVTSIHICCFSSYLRLSFVSSSDLWLSAIVMLLSDIICCSWPISAIYLSIYDYSLLFVHHMPTIWYYLRLLAIMFYYLQWSHIFCYDLLLSAMFSKHVRLRMTIYYYLLLFVLLPADFLALSATLCCYLQLPYVIQYGVLLYPIIWCFLLSSPTLLVPPAIIYDYLYCGLLSAIVGYDL